MFLSLCALVTAISFLTPDVHFVNDNKKQEAPLAPPKLKADDFSGIYHVQGTQDGNAYAGCTILKKQSDNTYIAHTIAGPVHTRGVGIAKGKVLSIAWRPLNSDGPLALGCTVYEISADGKTLDGEWYSPGHEQAHKERLTFLRKLE